MLKDRRDFAVKELYVLIIWLSCSLSVANAKNFYLSALNGNDKYTLTQAQNPSTPWKSISRLNEISSQLLPGDSVLFKRGEVFYGSITLLASGTQSLPIVISSYGSGEKAIVSGFTKLGSWTLLGNGVYESSILSVTSSPNMITMDGLPKAMGRFPNSGYLTYESSSNNSISDKQLSSSPNWTGAEIVIRKNHWITDRNPISSHRGNMIDFVSKSTYPGISGFGYFIQNDLRTLDLEGEWFFSSRSKTMLMYFGGKSPSSSNVQLATLETLLNLNKINNIVVDNLSFEGSNKAEIQISDAPNIEIRNCDFNFSGYNAITGLSNQGRSPNLKVENCSINNSNNNAIDLDPGFQNASVAKNNIKNTGLVAGMGGSGDGTYLAIYSRGANTTIEYNNVDYTGYSGISFKGSSVLVKNNFVNNSCLIKDDGAGIYTFRDKNDPIEYGQKIIGNIVLNSRGASDGTNPKATQAHGIYLDGNTMNVDVIDNTAADCTDDGLFINGSQSIIVSGNTFYNNNTQFEMYNWGPGIRKINVEDNIFFSKLKPQLAVDFYTKANDINQFGHSDKNYFIRPLGNDFLFHTQSTANSYPGDLYTLSNWASTYKQDLSSKTSPIVIPDYQLESLTSKNKVPSDYLTNKNASAIWPSDNSISFKINKEGKKAFKANVNKGGSGNDILVSIFDIGTVSSQKSYVLKFKATSNDERAVKIYLSQTGAPYATLSEAHFQNVSSTPNDFEIIFDKPTSASDARIVFHLDRSDGDIEFENIELYEANVKINDPADYIRFEYNATNTSKSISLDQPYVDAKNKSYQNKLSLAPFTSVVLIASGNLPKKLPQTISFPALPDRIYLDKPFKLSGASTSGLPLSFKLISGSASIKDSIITLLGAGAITVEAFQDGDSKFSSAVPVTRSFDVKKSPQNLNFPSISTKNLNQGSFALLASTSSNLTPSFRVISGPATISGSKITLTDIGTVKIESTQPGNGNYQAASSINQSFDVIGAINSADKSTQTIDFSFVSSINFTTAPIKLEAASSSGLDVKYAVLSGPATVSGNIISLTGSGTVVIEASQQGNSKYQAALPVVKSCKVMDRDVSTDKADQTIYLSRVWDRDFGAAPFSLNARSSSGLPINYRIVDGPASISGNIVSLTGAGSVTVECMQEGNEEYNAAIVVSQTFNINKANQHINFSTIPSKNYGDKPFKLESSAVSGLPINYSVVSGPVTISGDEVRLLGPGWVTIKASQEGNENYKMAQDVTRNFLVNEATQVFNYGRLITKNDHVPSTFENSGNSKDGIDESLNPVASNLQLYTYPNPFVGRLNIRFTPSYSGHATLKIYDFNGQVIKQLLEADVKIQEPKSFTFDASNNPNGIYVVRLTIAGKTFFQKVILKRKD